VQDEPHAFARQQPPPPVRRDSERTGIARREPGDHVRAGRRFGEAETDEQARRLDRVRRTLAAVVERPQQVAVEIHEGHVARGS
jgi:hypothetical protein